MLSKSEQRWLQEIVNGILQYHRTVFKKANAHIAFKAQEASDPARVVAVVDKKFSVRDLFTDRALPLLCFNHHVELCSRNPVSVLPPIVGLVLPTEAPFSSSAYFAETLNAGLNLLFRTAVTTFTVTAIFLGSMAMKFPDWKNQFANGASFLRRFINDIPRSIPCLVIPHNLFPTGFALAIIPIVLGARLRDFTDRTRGFHRPILA